MEALAAVLEAAGADEEGAEQRIEDLVEVMADFPSFCSLLEIKLKEEGDGGERVIPFDWDLWHEEQKRYHLARTARDIILKARQVGFTTVELARDFWYALAKPGAQVLVVVHDGELAEQLFTTVRLWADSFDRHGLLPPTRYSNKREIVFKASGGAIRIVEAGETEKAASKKGRSGTIHRLHATEQAFWGAAQETMVALTKAVPAGGEIVIESTANGVGGLFYEMVHAARDGRGGYTLHFYPWYEHEEYRLEPGPDFDPKPRDKWEERLRKRGCDDAQIAYWRSNVEDPAIKLEGALQELPIDVDTAFRSKQGAWFAADVLDDIAPAVREPMRLAPIVFRGRRFESARIFEQPRKGQEYVLFADAAEGIARDGSAVTVLHKRSGRTVATWWSDTTEAADLGLVCAVLGWFYNTALVGVERNDPGPATLTALTREAKYNRVYRHEDGRLGWPTNTATRPVLWEDLAFAIREGSATTPDASTLQECRTIVRDEDGKPRARGKKKKTADACRDDRYVSWAGAWQLRTRVVEHVGSFHIEGL